MVEHTHGPWSVFSPASAVWPGIESERGASVVIYGRDEEDAGIRGDSSEEVAANAALIAAAPELLAALRAVVARYGPSVTYLPEEGAWGLALAAITKAEGGQDG